MYIGCLVNCEINILALFSPNNTLDDVVYDPFFKKNEAGNLHS